MTNFDGYIGECSDMHDLVAVETTEPLEKIVSTEHSSWPNDGRNWTECMLTSVVTVVAAQST